MIKEAVLDWVQFESISLPGTSEKQDFAGKSHIPSCQIRSFQLPRLDFLQRRRGKAMPSRFSGDLLAVCGCMHVFISAYTVRTPCLRANYICTVHRSSIVASARDKGSKEKKKKENDEIWQRKPLSAICWCLRRAHGDQRKFFFFFFKCTTHWVARGSSPRLFISMSEGGNAHMRSHMQRGPCEIQRSRKETQRGKHSWLPLSLLTPAVGCNLPCKRNWQHGAFFFFLVLFFNTPFPPLFTAVSWGKCIPPPPPPVCVTKTSPLLIRCHQSDHWRESISLKSS